MWVASESLMMLLGPQTLSGPPIFHTVFKHETLDAFVI